jgi:hypothetical protein
MYIMPQQNILLVEMDRKAWSDLFEKAKTHKGL